MIPAIGDITLEIALGLGVIGVIAAIVAAGRGSTRWLSAARWSLVGLTLALTAASAMLVVALLDGLFRVEYVASYTERALPWGYKLAAFWAGQQGSLLLWAWMIAVMSAIAAFGFRRLSTIERATAVGTLTVICGFFAALLVFAANPFALINGVIPSDGRGLNPMLQDPGMIAHPPLLFLGYSGFAIPFAVLVGVLVSGRKDNRWIASIRRWTLVSWLFLTAGIVLGAWWAYVELGWGGYWAWDPVENASLLPWLTATALLHSIMVQQHRGMFKFWNAGLIAATFVLCIFGTYLTRSGVIDSVHAFPKSLIGQFFLVFLVILVVGSIGLIVWRRRALRSEHELEGVVSREGAFLAGNVLLVIMTATTLVGTIFPIISGLFVAEPVTVKPPFYNAVVAPMAIVLVAVMALGPVLAFGVSAAARIARALLVPAIVAAAATAAVAAAVTREPWTLVSVAITTLGTATVIVAYARAVAARHRSTAEPWIVAGLRMVDRDHRRYGGQLAHLGVMMIVIGVVGSSVFDQEQTVRLTPNASATIGEHTITFRGLAEVRYANFTAAEAAIELRDARGHAVMLRPQRRFYDTWREPNTEVAIRSTLMTDVYLTLAGWEAGGRIVALQVRVNPLVNWIWIGGIVMGLGALLCIAPPLLPRARAVRASEPAAAGAASATRQPVKTKLALEASG